MHTMEYYVVISFKVNMEALNVLRLRDPQNVLPSEEKQVAKLFT